MRKTRVFVVDDSMVVRRVLTREFTSDPQIELAGTAPNGRIAHAEFQNSLSKPAPVRPTGSLLTKSNGFRKVHRVEIIVVGASTGGPDALAELLPCFPEDFPVPILIVQHMPAPFMQALVDRLASRSRIGVVQGQEHQRLVPGLALLAPGGLHMRVEKNPGGNRIQMDPGPPEHSCRPSVDVLFRSAAEVYGAHVLAVVMTGMGQDGFDGCKKVRDAGGQILVQDEASSVVWGMPRLVAEAGLVDQILPLAQLGPAIVRRVK